MARSRKSQSETRVAIYARVSTDDQSVENQLVELKRVAKRNSWHVVEVFTDRGISGKKGRDNRPAFDHLLDGAVRKEFDIIMAWSVDRLGRSLQHLVDFLNEIHAKDIDLYLHQQGIDTTTPAGKAMFHMCGVFAEFERSLIRERTIAGLKRARAAGKQLGRPRISQEKEQEILKIRAKGKGIHKTAALAKVGVATVQRVLREDSQRVPLNKKRGKEVVA